MPGLLAEILTAGLILAGSFFLLVGSWGLVKLPTLAQRLHAPTKSTTLGVGGILLGSVLEFGLIEHRLTLHEVLITLFLFLSAPVTALMIAKAYLHRHRIEAAMLPPTGRPVGWATLDDEAAGTTAPAPDRVRT